MRQDRYTIVLLLILLFQISGYTTEDILLKTWGRYPFVMIANHDKIYLSYSTQSSDITPLGCYQYDLHNNVFTDSTEVMDSPKHTIENSIIARIADRLLIGFTAVEPGYWESYIYIRSFDLNGSPLSPMREISRENCDNRRIIGNIACDDTMFLVVWNDDYGGILGQFISCSLVEEGDTIMISDTAYEPYAASVDYNNNTGHFITVWTDGRTDLARPYGRIFNRDRSAWGPTLALSDPSLEWHGPIGYPHVLWNSDSTFTVFYWTNHENIYCQTFSEQGHPVNSLCQLNAEGLEADDFAVARDSLGRMVAVWEDLTSGKLFCQRFNADASLRDLVFVLSTGTYNIPNEAISVDFKDGLVCAVWNDTDYRLWLQRFDFDNPNQIMPEESLTAPRDFRLAGNYPNPFNATTKIRFYLPQAGPVELKVWDCRVVLVRKRQYSGCLSGRNEIDFKADDLPSGMYMYEVRSGKNASRAKMLLMK